VRKPDLIGVLLVIALSVPAVARADGASAPPRGDAKPPNQIIVVRPPPIVRPPAPPPVIPVAPLPPPRVTAPSVTPGSSFVSPGTLSAPPRVDSDRPSATMGAPSSVLSGVAARDFVANQVIVAMPAADRAAPVGNEYGLSVAEETVIGALGLRLVAFTVAGSRALGDVMDQMGLDPRVRAAQPNFRYRTSASIYTYPHSRTQLEPARALASGVGVTIAVIDTAVANLPSLSGQIERVSLVKGGSSRHGTAVASLVAEVAPAARLIAIEAFEEDAANPQAGTSTTITLARAIDAALSRNAAVINLSATGPRDPLVGRMVRQALSRGVVVVAAAGNDGPEAPPLYPAAYDGVVAVTAVDSHDHPYASAARGAHVAVAAPGVDVAVDLSGGRVGYVSGTSVAAAQVAGVAALLRERAPRLGSPETREVLTETATSLPDGLKMLNAFAAVSKVSQMTRR
jgi:subtilisin family serine protease